MHPAIQIEQWDEYCQLRQDEYNRRVANQYRSIRTKNSSIFKIKSSNCKSYSQYYQDYDYDRIKNELYGDSYYQHGSLDLW